MHRFGRAFGLCSTPDSRSIGEVILASSPKKHQTRLLSRKPRSRTERSDTGGSPPSPGSPASSASEHCSEGSDGSLDDRATWMLGDSCLHPSAADHSQCDATASAQFVEKRFAKEVKQPGDGSCLFHALAFGLRDGTDAAQLRREICHCIQYNPDMRISSLSLKDWIKMDSGRSIRRYAEKMRGRAHGGGIEIELFTRLKQKKVHIYERCDGGYRRICCFEGDGSNDKGTVNVLYRGRCHYDTLLMGSEMAKL